MNEQLFVCASLQEISLKLPRKQTNSKGKERIFFFFKRKHSVLLYNSLKLHLKEEDQVLR